MKQCYKCNTQKPLDEFYNSKNAKDGKQPMCKVCTKEYGKKWRTQINPDYFWGEEGYFKRRYEETVQYQKDYRRADKTVKIYQLTTENGDIYIGYTKRPIAVRLIEHRRHWTIYSRDNKHPYRRPISLYHYFVNNNYTDEQIKKVWDSVKILEEFKGDKYKAHKKEIHWIHKLHKKGYNLINTDNKPKS